MKVELKAVAWSCYLGDDLEVLAKFTGKQPVLESVFNKAVSRRPLILLKGNSDTVVFV